MEEGSLVRVIRDFLTLNDGELSVVKDEVLQIVQVVDRHWVRCQNVRDVGLVPKNNICPVDNVPHSIGNATHKKVSQFHVKYLKYVSENGHFILVADSNFNSEAEGDLTIHKGDLIIGLEAIDHAWTKGRNSQGLVGIFPTSFCWRPDTDLLFKNRSKVNIWVFTSK